MPRLRTLSLGLFLEVVALSFIETEGVPCGGEDVFICANLTCIPLHWRCDGENDCGDNSDEYKCPEVTCTPVTQFSCGGGHCIPKRWVCDRDEDCNDGSDEPADCAKRTCSPTEYKCGNGRCIPQRWLCDHEDDCGDNSDEKNCRNVTCKSDEYMCKNKKCITKQWVCDYDNDCGDHSDEEKCPPHTCKSSEFTCLNKRCIRSDWKCDGDNDCKDNSDELGCPSLSPHCSDNEVQCNTGECIHKGWWCDGEVDCHNGTDEKGCSKNCHKSQFECKNTRCVSLTKVCNGKNDCHDNSDEQDCPEPTPPVCPQGQFQCGSDDQCIDEQKVCNNYDDCKNGADEPKSCNENECLKNNGGCQHMCNDTLTSYFCSCKRGYQVNRGNRNKCTDVNECLEFGACSQICENTKGSFKCSCLDGYKLEPDDRTCKAVGPEGFLIFANRQDLRRIRLDSSDYTELVGQQRAAIAVDFHAHKATIFWSDVMNEEIRRAPLGNGSAVTSIIKTGLHTPDGIAVDWVNDKIYWTDTGNDNIEVAGLNGLGRLTLISDGLDEPRAIALYPGIGYMYWTDWGETAKIERCGMNGDPETRKVIVSSNILWPNAITIDLTLDKIWWADAKLHTIEAADLDGSHRIIILGEDIFHPFGLTLFQDYMYWTDWQKDSIYRANKFTGKGKSVVGDNLFSPMDLQLYHFQRQPKSINPCAKRLCSHICLLAPRPLGSTCHCEPGVKLLGDGKTCNTSGAFECQENRCKNNGTCVSKENATVLPKCLCLSEFTGDRCQYRIASGGGGVGDGNTVATRVSSNDKESESIGTTVGIAIGVVLGILIISLIVGYFIYRRIKKQSYTPDRPGSSVYKRTTESTTSLDAERSLKFDSLNKGNSFKVYFSKSSRGRNDQALLSDVGNDS